MCDAELCPSCSEPLDFGDALYECDDCGEAFTREDTDSYTNRCPSCNRFAARIGTRCECGEDVIPEPESVPDPGPHEVEIRVLRNPEPWTPPRSHPEWTHVLMYMNCPGAVGGVTDPDWRSTVVGTEGRCPNCYCYPVTPVSFTIIEDVPGGPQDWPGWSEDD